MKKKRKASFFWWASLENGATAKGNSILEFQGLLTVSFVNGEIRDHIRNETGFKSANVMCWSIYEEEEG